MNNNRDECFKKAFIVSAEADSTADAALYGTKNSYRND
jgi:hypothetical protein